jgi:hypothetical protein
MDSMMDQRESDAQQELRRRQLQESLDHGMSEGRMSQQVIDAGSLSGIPSSPSWQASSIHIKAHYHQNTPTTYEVVEAPPVGKIIMQMLINANGNAVQFKDGVFYFGGHNNVWVGYRAVGVSDNGSTLILIRDVPIAVNA